MGTLTVVLAGCGFAAFLPAFIVMVVLGNGIVRYRRSRVSLLSLARQWAAVAIALVAIPGPICAVLLAAFSEARCFDVCSPDWSGDMAGVTNTALIGIGPGIVLSAASWMAGVMALRRRQRVQSPGLFLLLPFLVFIPLAIALALAGGEPFLPSPTSTEAFTRWLTVATFVGLPILTCWPIGMLLAARSLHPPTEPLPTPESPDGQTQTSELQA